MNQLLEKLRPLAGKLGAMQQSTQPQAQQAPIQPPKPKKTTVVKFDTKTEHPFDVKFSERGFQIGETRLSFELIETAVSKNLNLVLDNGKGIVLDAIKMQKILKYKDL